MRLTSRFIQAYRQAPWRVQLQWSGLFLLVLVTGVLIAAVYLNISARAAEAGLEAKRLEGLKEDSQRTIADMHSKLASLTSKDVMEKRAEKMGFVDTDPNATTYIVVTGYPGRQPVVLAPPPGPEQFTPSILKPSYTQSLSEWLFQGVLSLGKNEGATR